MTIYRKAQLALTLGLITSLGYSQSITTPRTASPAASVSQKIGISDVSITYSRPSVRGRQIWGSLVPYGWNVQGFGLQNSAPWRSGANENTTITFSHNTKVEGQEVPAGTYGLFFVINEDNSGEVVLSKDTQSWGSFFYVPGNDQMKANITLRDIEHTETLQYDFINLDKTSGELVLNWEKKQFPVKIEYDVDAIVMANAQEELKGVTGFSPQGFASAANYALQNNVNLDQGLVWIDRAIAQNPNFNNSRIKAGLLTQLGKTDEADKIMEGALSSANEAQLNVYGYQLLGQSKFDEAIKVFKINTDQNPKSANAWDSLGEGYALAGKKKEAIASFKKSLSLNPAANVKANSEKYLKQFGAL